MHKERIEAVHAGDFTQLRAHGCVKPYCCLFVCIESLLRSDRRYQTERGSVSGVSNEPNRPNLLYVALGPPFILSRGYPQVAT